MRAALVATGVGIALLSAMSGCSSESSSPNRSTVSAPADGGADGDAAVAQPDPNGGRDDNGASCYAACQNGGFTCLAKGDTVVTTVEMTPETNGCGGTLTTGSTTPTEKSVLIKIDCHAITICKGDAPEQPATTCVPGTFSAFSFAYGSPQIVCTRN